MNYVFVSPHRNDFLTLMFNDFYLSDMVDVIDESYPVPSNPLARFIKRVHLSVRLEERIDLPFRELWKVPIEEYAFKEGEKYCIFFLRDSLPSSAKTLIELKKKYDLIYVLLLMDPKYSDAERKTRVFMKHGGQGIFDYLFTINAEEVKEYGYIYYDTYYSKVPQFDSAPHVRNDLFFVGLNKGRLNTLYDIKELSSAHGISFLCYVNEVQKDLQRELSGVIFNEILNYHTTLQKTMESNCILEIIPKGVTAPTARYREAVCYNKKLLTNNKNIVNLPYYNPDFVRVFESADDIDWAWVKERVPVDYHYDGSYSPLKLLDKISDLEREKENSNMS